MNTDKNYCCGCGRIIPRVKKHIGMNHRYHLKCWKDNTPMLYDNETGLLRTDYLQRWKDEINAIL